MRCLKIMREMQRLYYLFFHCFHCSHPSLSKYCSKQELVSPFFKGAGWGLLVKGLTTSFLTGLLGTAGASLSTLLGLGVTLWYFVRIETKELNAFGKNGILDGS